MGAVFNYSLTSWQHHFSCICNSPSTISPAETCFWCSKKQVCYWGLVVRAASFQLKRLGTILFIKRHLFFSEDRMYYRCHLMRTQWCTLLYSSSNLITLLKILLIIYHPCAFYVCTNFKTILGQDWLKLYFACSRADHDTSMHQIEHTLPGYLPESLQSFAYLLHLQVDAMLKLWPNCLIDVLYFFSLFFLKHADSRTTR
jgi:hypothetical protein